MTYSYDVVIVGGAIMGSSVAFFLSRNPDFGGTILVVERDPSYVNSSTACTNSCMRQQFSREVNIRISQFAAEFVRDFRNWMDDAEAPEVPVNHFGYMYLAADEAAAAVMEANQRVQASLGAGTVIMTPEEIAAEYPFYNVDGILCGSHNLVDEGWFDSGTVFDWWRRQARGNGVEYVTDEVVGIDRSGDAVTGVELASGGRVGCSSLVNATGPRAERTAAMAGLELPVEPRKRFTWIFEAAEPLERDLPLTIDPTGVHVRSDGGAYLAGCPPDVDPPGGLRRLRHGPRDMGIQSVARPGSPDSCLRANQGHQPLGRTIRPQPLGPQRSGRTPHRGAELLLRQRLLRPRYAAVAGNGAGRLRADHLR